jgi:hypothetical protein
MVFASATAWYRIVREFNFRRPGVRIYPPKPKIGIRALEPNQIWHVDVSVFRIVNGAKAYIQAIIDNASRCVEPKHSIVCPPKLRRSVPVVSNDLRSLSEVFGVGFWWVLLGRIEIMFF